MSDISLHDEALVQEVEASHTDTVDNAIAAKLKPPRKQFPKMMKNQTVISPLPRMTYGELQADELNFVLGTWKLSNRWAVTYLPDEPYNVSMDKFVAALSLTQRLLVGRTPEGRIVGWVCYRNRLEEDPAIVVHYVYVRREYRCQGAAKRLLIAAGWRGEQSDVILASHKCRFPPETRHKYNIYFNDFFCKAGQV